MEKKRKKSSNNGSKPAKSPFPIPQSINPHIKIYFIYHNEYSSKHARKPSPANEGKH